MNNVKIYEPNKNLTVGIFNNFKTMFEDFILSKELGMRFFKRDFIAKYRQSLFGLLWVVLMPLFTVSVFVMMNLSGVLNVGETGVPYVVYALFGLTLWNLFTGLASNVAGSIGSLGGMIGKINFPRIAMVYSPVLTTIVDFLIRNILLVIVMLFMNTMPVLTIIPIALLALIPLMLLAIGIGLIFSIINVVLKDLSNILGMAFSFLMYVSPVIYTVKDRGGLIGFFAKYNPLTSLLDFPRNLFFYGNFQDYKLFLAMSALSLLVFLIGWRFFSISISRIVEKI